MLKRYKVTGKYPVLQNEPGKTFQAELPRDQEQRLIAAGHITEVKEVVKRGKDHP